MTRAWMRWVAILAAVVVVLGATVVLIAVRARVLLEGRSDELLAAVGRAIGLPLSAEEVFVSWWPPGVTAQELEIPDESPYGPGDLARADEARIQVALLPLLRGELVVTEIRLLSPVLFVVRGFDGGWNLAATSLHRAPGEERGGERRLPAPRVVIDSVRVRNARIVYRDRAIPGLGELEVKAGNLLLRNRSDSYRVDFNAQALGGPEENVSGWMMIPIGGDASANATLDVEATRLAGDRLPEVIALLRGDMPFGISLDGDVAVRVEAQLPAVWPPGRARARLALDADEASLRAADGWVVKNPGTPFDVDFALRAGDFGLAVDHATAASDDARLTARLAEPRPPPADAGQQPLIVALEGFDASGLGDWVPALAEARPRGDLLVEGRITPGADGVASDLRVVASDLGFYEGAAAVTVASASLDLAFAHGSDGVLGALRVSELRGPQGTVASASADVGGKLETPLDVHVNAARASRNGVEVDGLSLDLVLAEQHAEIRSLQVFGLGGTLAARGRVRREGRGFTVAVEPEWRDLDLGALTRLVANESVGSGRFAGTATLSSEGDSVQAGLAQLSGRFRASLDGGSLPGLNPARATLASLDEIPRLKEAVDRRARERLPELLAPTSEIVSLEVEGTIADGRIAIGSLQLESRDYALEAEGRLALDGEVDLRGTLELTPAASRSLVSGSGVLATLARSDEQIRIPIAVRGDYPNLSSHPSKDYLAQATARALKLPSEGGAASILRRLLGDGP